MDQKEINKTLMENSKMIIMFATRSHGGNKRKILELDDFIQEAYAISADLLKRYDKSIGKASTYLYAALPLALKRFKKQNMYSIRIPEHIFAKASEIEKYCKANKISIYDISTNEVGMILKTTQEVSDMVIKVMTHTPFTTPIYEEHYSCQDNEYYEDIDNLIDNKKLYNLIVKEIDNLPYRESKILKDYYINESSLVDIGKRYSLSPSRIGQITRSYSVKIKNKLNKYRRI